MGGMTMFKFTLYVARRDARCDRALANLEGLCRDGTLDYEVDVVNIRESPHVAEAQNILATPTLIKKSPLPECRAMGDLNDREKLAILLDISIPKRQLGSVQK